MNKKTVSIIIAVVIVLAMAVTAVVVIRNKSGENESSLSNASLAVSSNDASSRKTATTKKTTKTTDKSKTTKYDLQPGNLEETTAEHPYIDEEGLWTDGFARLQGLWKLKLDGDKTATYHYFTSGKVDKDHVGLGYASDTDDYYYVKNGTIDYTYNGLISVRDWESKQNYLAVFKNGKMQKDYNGMIELPNAKAHVKNGYIVDFNVGNPEGYEYKPIFWGLDDGTQVTNLSREAFQ